MTRWFGFVTGVDSLNGLAMGLSDWALRGAIVLAMAAIMAWVLRGRSATVRHWVWAAGLVSVLALPVAARVAPGWTLPSFSVGRWNRRVWLPCENRSGLLKRSWRG